MRLFSRSLSPKVSTGSSSKIAQASPSKLKVEFDVEALRQSQSAIKQAENFSPFLASTPLVASLENYSFKPSEFGEKEIDVTDVNYDPSVLYEPSVLVSGPPSSFKSFGENFGDQMSSRRHVSGAVKYQSSWPRPSRDS